MARSVRNENYLNIKCFFVLKKPPNTLLQRSKMLIYRQTITFIRSENPA
jgi:hypothetical protein